MLQKELQSSMSLAKNERSRLLAELTVSAFLIPIFTFFTGRYLKISLLLFNLPHTLLSS